MASSSSEPRLVVKELKDVMRITKHQMRLDRK